MLSLFDLLALAFLTAWALFCAVAATVIAVRMEKERLLDPAIMFPLAALWGAALGCIAAFISVLCS